jgi:hypothetical protein
MASVLPTEATPPIKDTVRNVSTRASARPKATPTAAKPATPQRQKEVVTENDRPFDGNVQVIVKVDASNLTPQQIAELVRELRRPFPT